MYNDPLPSGVRAGGEDLRLRPARGWGGGCRWATLSPHARASAPTAGPRRATPPRVVVAVPRRVMRRVWMVVGRMGRSTQAASRDAGGAPLLRSHSRTQTGGAAVASAALASAS